MKKIVAILLGLLLGISVLSPLFAMAKNIGDAEVDAARAVGMQIRSAVKEAFNKKDPSLFDQARKEWLKKDGNASAFIYTRFSSLVEAFSQAPDMGEKSVQSVLKARENKLGFEVDLDSSYANNIGSYNLALRVGGKTLSPLFQRSEVVNTVRSGEYCGRIVGLFNTGPLTGGETVKLEVRSKSKDSIVAQFTFCLADCR